MAMEGSTSRSPPTSARRESSSCSTWEGSLLFPTSGEEGEKLGALCVRETAGVVVACHVCTYIHSVVLFLYNVRTCWPKLPTNTR